MPSTLGIVASGVADEFSPLDLAPALWLDAADTTTITASGSPLRVSQWDDRSGNNAHFVQSTGANQPSTGQHTRNGYNVLTFDNNRVLVGPTTPELDAIPGNPFEVFVAFDEGTSGTFFSQNETNTTALRRFQLFLDSISSVGSVVKGSGTSLNRTPRTGRWRVGGFSWDGTTGTVRDGNSTVGANIGSASEVSPPMRIGARGPGASFPLTNGRVGEVVVVMRHLSANERNSLFEYLANKWDVTL